MLAGIVTMTMRAPVLAVAGWHVQIHGCCTCSGAANQNGPGGMQRWQRRAGTELNAPVLTLNQGRAYGDIDVGRNPDLCLCGAGAGQTQSAQCASSQPFFVVQLHMSPPL